jgi:ATP-dependent Lhr-like helicase
LLETYRECLRDVFDLPGLVEVLRGVESRKVRVVTADTRTASPFASNVLFSYVASFLYDGDAPLAERRAQALTIDHAQLRELLGETELRKLLDGDVIEEHERTLQRLAHPARSPDAFHDLLRLLGDLSPDEIEARIEPSKAARGWIDALVVERRIIAVKIAKQARYAAAEDAGRLRDALGIVPPQGLPAAFLESTARPVADVVARYARTHGPFAASDVVKRFGLGVATVEQALADLVRDGRVVGGEFLPRGAGREYCDVEVLAALRRKSLARIRRAVEPVDAAAYARFLVDWSGVGQKRRGPDALLASITQLEGAPLVASTLESEILAARVDDYRAWDLDRLCASGEVVWGGLEPIGPSDGRIALFVADHEPLLAAPATRVDGAIAEKIRALLGRRGAVFFAEITRETGGFPGDALEALWDMVWAGEVTNDTLEPLRSRLRAAPRTPSKRRLERSSRAMRSGPPGSEGRWSLRAARWAREVAETERRAATARTLLERHGIVMRETAHAEGLAGGFSAVYAVFQAMEHAGRVRRGYFVAGRGGAQFALPGAEERLRARRDPSDEPATLILAATDPASAFGASLPWPEARGNAKPQRAAGALVVIRDGELLAWIGRSEQTLLTFLPTDAGARDARARALASALYGLARTAGRRALLIATIDGDDASRSGVAPHLVAAGFVTSGRELLLRARDATRDPTAGGIDARR